MYCKQCGSKLENQDLKKCPKCNTIVGRGGRYCSICGQSVQSGSCGCAQSDPKAPNVPDHNIKKDNQEKKPNVAVTYGQQSKISNPLFAKIANMQTDNHSKIDNIKNKVAQDIYNEMVESGEIVPVEQQIYDEHPKEVFIPVIKPVDVTPPPKIQTAKEETILPDNQTPVIDDVSSKKTPETQKQNKNDTQGNDVSDIKEHKVDVKKQNKNGVSRVKEIKEDKSNDSKIVNNENIQQKKPITSFIEEVVTENGSSIPNQEKNASVNNGFGNPIPSSSPDIAVLAQQQTLDKSQDYTVKKSSGKYIKIPEKASFDGFWVFGALCCVLAMLILFNPSFSLLSMNYITLTYCLCGLSIIFGILDIFLNRKKTGAGVVMFAVLQILLTIIL